MRLVFDASGHHEGPPHDPGHPRPRRYMMAVLTVVAVGLLTREAIIVPFTVGYTAARRLVQQEDQEAALHKQAAEYRAAAEFYRTPEGQEAAGRLALNVPGPGERRAILEPEAPATPARGGVRNTLLEIETRLAEAVHFQMRVLRRWAHDPPREKTVLPGGRGTQSPKTGAATH